ncbi:MAG: rolling circle replication-associated protein [Gemmatimonas sp.]
MTRPTLVRAWGEYLNRYQWNHWVTLTTEDNDSVEAIVREFHRGFIRRLERRAQRRVDWVYAAERSSAAQNHLHALVYGTSHLTVRNVQRAWDRGLTTVTRYSDRLGAAWYLMKQLGDVSLDDTQYDLSQRMPPLLRRGRSEG